MGADSDTSSDEKGVGAPNRRHLASSSSSKKCGGKSVSCQKELNTSDENWPKDIPSDYQRCLKTFEDMLRAAIHQGKFEVCWAVGLARCMEALYKIKYNITVHLSAQHLINNIKKTDRGKVTKYGEIKNFLINHGLVLEEACPFTGKIDQECPKTCGGDTYKIKDLIYIKIKDVNEEQVIKFVNDCPVLAVVEAYKSFLVYKEKDGIYDGKKNHKDDSTGRHVVLVGGFNTTLQGLSYWIIQNSWGLGWGKNGFGKLMRKSSRDGKPSLFLKLEI